MLPLFSGVLLVSAFLVFSIQPLAGKSLLPVLGGAPSVWNVCMVFFQTALLMGYLYAMVVTWIRKKNPWTSLILQGVMWIVALILVPRELPSQAWVMNSDSHPALLLWMRLTSWIGFPFLILSSTSTLLQDGLASSDHPSSRNPYLLYAASNGGSILALLAYPFLIEPLMPLPLQQESWRFLMMGLGGGVMVCGFFSMKYRSVSETRETVSIRDLGKWVLLSAIPSGLLQGVTTFISTDIAAVPLLWILPLFLYLLTFVVVFSDWSRWVIRFREGIWRIASFTTIIILIKMALEDNAPHSVLIGMHLLSFFLFSLLIHSSLAESKPSAGSLGVFYFALSLGGVVGGAICSLAAPMLFDRILEYPLFLLGACGIIASRIQGKGKLRLAHIGNALAVSVLVLLTSKMFEGVAFGSAQSTRFLILAIPVILTYRWVRQGMGYVISLTALFFSISMFLNESGEMVLDQGRNFFGVTRVVRDEKLDLNLLTHGSTVHGIQKMSSTDPLSYYHQGGPLGGVFRYLHDAFPDSHQVRVGAVGLGAGSVASYAREGEQWTFFELNPEMVRIAHEPKLFTHLQKSRARQPIPILIGDARLRLKEVPDRSFSLLILDAFSSDSIPTHLLSREGLELEWMKVAPKGVLAFHLSNRYFDLLPVIQSHAEAMGLSAIYSETHEFIGEKRDSSGRSDSRWALLMDRSTVEGFWRIQESQSPWIQNRLEVRAGGSKYTDDFFNLLSRLKINGMD